MAKRRVAPPVGRYLPLSILREGWRLRRWSMLPCMGLCRGGKANQTAVRLHNAVTPPVAPHTSSRSVSDSTPYVSMYLLLCRISPDFRFNSSSRSSCMSSSLRQAKIRSTLKPS